MRIGIFVARGLVSFKLRTRLLFEGHLFSFATNLSLNLVQSHNRLKNIKHSKFLEGCYDEI